MAFYESSDQFYACAEILFDRLQKENPGASDEVVRAKILIRLSCTDPPAVILVNGRRNPAVITYGANRIRPEVDIALETDTLHAILLGELDVPKALSRKLLKVRGPVWKVAALAGLFQKSQALYAEVLKDQGLLN